jgi:hypothetical protein
MNTTAERLPKEAILRLELDLSRMMRRWQEEPASAPAPVDEFLPTREVCHTLGQPWERLKNKP